MPFWEGISLNWDKQWDMAAVQQIVLGGDGAHWIEAGAEEVGYSVYQADGFHLSRACGRGWEGGSDIGPEPSKILLFRITD